jgi:hypothetical protein
MGYFRRRKGGDGQELPGDGEPDHAFPFLTVGQAARLRALARQQLAECGIESEIRADHLLATGGWRVGLHNLFVACHHAPGGERAWSGIIRSHVATVVRRADEPSPAELPGDQLLDRAFVRVCGASVLPSMAAFGYRRRLGGDLVELLAYDSPETVAYLTDAEVERVGADALRAAGVEHLLTEPFGEVHWLTAQRGARFAVLLGESVHTASRLLIFDDVLRRSLGDVDTPYGVIVSVPNRHQLVFHRPEDSSVLRAVEGLTRFTIDNFAEGAGGVSPHVFWRPPRGGALQQLTEVARPGHVAVRIDGEFARAIRRLLGLSPPS